jgi:hypothetical protein
MIRGGCGGGDGAASRLATGGSALTMLVIKKR